MGGGVVGVQKMLRGHVARWRLGGRERGHRFRMTFKFHATHYSFERKSLPKAHTVVMGGNPLIPLKSSSILSYSPMVTS